MDVLRKKLKRTSDNNGEVGSGTEKKESVFNKNKLLSTWYNMKYGKSMFALESNTLFTSGQSPVWLLGQCYHKRMRQRIHYTEQAESLTEIESGIAAFYEDFSSRIWLTYRRNFEEFKGSQVTTDCGWGCMIRSGQMLVANTLVQLELSRHWRKMDPSKSVHLAEDIGSESIHKNIIRLFGDSYENSPLSIHNIMDVAQDTFSKKPGDWFGPSATAHILQKTIDQNRNTDMLNNLRAYVAKDGTVYKGDIYKMCRIIKKEIKASRSSFDSIINIDEYSIIDPNELLTASSIAFAGGQTNQFETEGFVPYLMEGCENIQVENEEHLSPKHQNSIPSPGFRQRSLSLPSLNNCSSWIPVLILVPVRLGRDEKLNPIYANCLKSFLATETCMGIIGGKPKHSLYFIGFQDDNLIHLDPHLSQEKVDVSLDEFDLESYHTKTARKLPINKMDSSCCLGFLLENENQFEGWCELAMELARPSYGVRSDYPLFTITDGTSWEHLKQGAMAKNIEATAEVLSHFQQLDSIDEAGIDANLMVPPSDEEEFIFV